MIAKRGRGVQEPHVVQKRPVRFRVNSMFSGIIEETGTVERAERHGDILAVRIAAKGILNGLELGGSVAVNGCCLTAIRVDSSGFNCELTQETLQRTRFDTRLRAGSIVNLERPLRADGRFDGHIVQGHVDGIGHIRELRRLGGSAELVVATPGELLRYLVEKGSVAVDGISLTVARLEAEAFAVAVIPYTLERTHLRGAGIGDPVNLEVDIVAKYVERLLAVTRKP